VVAALPNSGIYASKHLRFVVIDGREQLSCASLYGLPKGLVQVNATLELAAPHLLQVEAGHWDGPAQQHAQARHGVLEAIEPKLAACGSRRPRASARRPLWAPAQSDGRLGPAVPPWNLSEAPPKRPIPLLCIPPGTGRGLPNIADRGAQGAAQGQRLRRGAAGGTRQGEPMIQGALYAFGFTLTSSALSSLACPQGVQLRATCVL